MIIKKSLQEDIIHILTDIPEVKRVILFGSRARGDADDRSDIDLAIEAPKASRRQWLEVLLKLEDLETLLPIDVIRLEEAPALLKERIFKEGIVLYERP